MRRSEVRQAFQEFLRLQSIVDAGNLEPEDNVQARVDLWEQVRILREQVDAYRQAGPSCFPLKNSKHWIQSGVRGYCQRHTSERGQELTQDQVPVQGQEICR